MKKKSDRKSNETKTSPEKSHRSSRSSRRRKKSSSSEAEPEAAENKSSDEEVVLEKKSRSRSNNVESGNDKSPAASSKPGRQSRRQAAAEKAKTELLKDATAEESKNVTEISEVEAPEVNDSALVGSTNGTESPATTAQTTVQSRRSSASVESSPSSAQKQRRESQDTSNTNEDDTHVMSKVNESADDDDVVQIDAEPVDDLESNQNDASGLGRSESPELNYSPDREVDSRKVDQKKDKARSDSESEGSEGESGASRKKSVLSSVSQVDSSMKKRRKEDAISGRGGEQEEEEGRAEEDGNKQDGSDIEELKQETDNDIEEIAEVVAKTSAAPLPREQRKRRWGTCRASKVEPPVVISSDYLKTIIPDVKPIAEDELKFSDGKSSGDEDEEEGEIKTERESSEDELICDQTVILDDDKPTKKKEKSKEESKKSEKREKDSKDAKSSEKLKKGSREPLKMAAVDQNSKGKQVVRKISIVTEEAKKLARPPTPSRNTPSSILFIKNLVRPFTILQLRELLQRTGRIKEGGFWIDAIKSKCYVEFENEDQAVETRHALHDVRWPVSNPKLLHVDFAKKEDLLAAQASTSDSANRKVENIIADPYSVKKAKANAPVREWDVGKPSFPDEIMMDDRSKGLRGYDEIKLERDRERDRKDRDKVRDRDRGGDRDRDREHDRDRDRKNRKEKYRRSRSPLSLEPPSRRRRKDDEAPAKLLDDLFCKTKVSPCIYWLPLSSEQIAMKEEQRRQAIEELDKRMAMASNRDRKESTRERDRDRDRDKDSRRKDRSRDRDHSSHRK